MANKRKEKPLQDLAQLEKAVGQFMAYWGFKSIHGRIWLHLYLSEHPLDSAELMKRLKVSKGLMSTAVRKLLEYEVIQPVQTGRHGTVFYEANPDLQSVISGVLRSRERLMLNTALDACRRLAKEDRKALRTLQLSHERVQSVTALTESAQSLLSAFLSMKPARGNFGFPDIHEENFA